MTKPPVVADVDTALAETARRRRRMDHDHPSYKWIVLSNTTLGTLLATINASIVLISLPAIFRGIGLNPLAPGNVSYLLWMLMGYLVVTAVLVVPFGRLGDMFGRVRIYNLGFAVFTFAAIALSFDPFHMGRRGAVADRLARAPRRGRRDADGVLLGDPDRRVPRQPARHGARGQHGGCCCGVVPWIVDRWLPLRMALEGHLLGRRADRHPRHHLEHPVAQRARGPYARPTGLGRHPVLRHRPYGAADGNHLRHPALR